jgi:hypothetical protein
VGLVDAMLNRAAMWGEGILDAAAGRLRTAAPTVVLDRVRVDPLAHAGRDRWVAAMLQRYEALVVATGD